MRMTFASLVAPATLTAARVDPAIALDILWAAAYPADLIEHIHVRASSGRIDLVIYHLATDPTTAAQTLLDLCRRAQRGSPVLRGWSASVASP